MENILTLEQINMAKTPIKPYGVKELSILYGVSRSTMRKHIKMIKGLGDRVGHYWNNKQVRKIFEHLDPPESE